MLQQILGTTIVRKKSMVVMAFIYTAREVNLERWVGCLYMDGMTGERIYRKSS